VRPFAVVTLILIALCVQGCPSGDPGEVGNTVCLACHDGRSAPDQSQFPMSTHSFLDCERCHGPGYLHTRNGGREGAHIENPALRPFDELHLLCQECHPGTTDAYLQSVHFDGEIVTCIDCHNVHSPDETTKPFTDNSLCLQCHASLGFATEAAIEAHTFHSVDPEGTGASRCTTCHMVPLRRDNQASGRHYHDLIPLPPVLSNEAIDAGVTPTPPNSCAGIMGCHDGTVPTAPVFNVDDPADNALLQIIFEARYGS